MIRVSFEVHHYRAMGDIPEKELAQVKLAFDNFADPDGSLDGTKVAQVIACLELNPTLARLTQLELPKKEGEKKFTLEEVLPIYTELKKEKGDQGCYEDFIEVLKLYDKNENGRMMSAELSHILQSLGEQLAPEQVDELFEDCVEEDEEGEMAYVPFLKRMCGMAPILRRKRN